MLHFPSVCLGPQRFMSAVASSALLDCCWKLDVQTGCGCGRTSDDRVSCQLCTSSSSSALCREQDWGEGSRQGFLPTASKTGTLRVDGSRHLDSACFFPPIDGVKFVALNFAVSFWWYRHLTVNAPKIKLVLGRIEPVIVCSRSLSHYPFWRRRKERNHASEGRRGRREARSRKEQTQTSSYTPPPPPRHRRCRTDRDRPFHCVSKPILG